MVASLHFSPPAEALTAESARVALCLWLEARRAQARFTVSVGEAPWRDELRWLGLEWDAEAASGDAPAWLKSLPALEECEPSPWGQWSGRTRIGELHELGVLPEALLDFLARTAWAPPAANDELLSREQLISLWSPGRLRVQPVRFDFEELRRINHAWLQRADLDRLLELSLPYFRRVGWLPADELLPVIRGWLRDVIRAVLPGLDFLSLLPPPASSSTTIRRTPCAWARAARPSSARAPATSCASSASGCWKTAGSRSSVSAAFSKTSSARPRGAAAT